MNAEQLQHACDLINHNNERMDDAPPKCKVGKLCNGRCIPQNHKCIPTGGLKLPEETAEGHEGKAKPKQKLTLEQKVALGYIGTYVGLQAAAAVAHHHLNTEHKEHLKNAKENQRAYEEHLNNAKKSDKEYQEHLSNHPEEKATYEKAKAAAKENYGDRGSEAVHNTLRDNWQRQKGVPDPMQPKVKDWHKTLGVSKNASPEDVKKAYRTLSSRHHPDKGGKVEDFQKINEAYKASKRKDALDVWQSIESAYQSAQQHHSRVDSSFWKL